MHFFIFVWSKSLFHKKHRHILKRCIVYLLRLFFCTRSISFHPAYCRCLHDWVTKTSIEKIKSVSNSNNSSRNVLLCRREKRINKTKIARLADMCCLFGGCSRSYCEILYSNESHPTHTISSSFPMQFLFLWCFAKF